MAMFKQHLMHLTNTAVLDAAGKLGTFDTSHSTRQFERHLAVATVTVEFQRKYAGSGRGGHLQWTEALCPRRRRRRIIRDAVKIRRAKLRGIQVDVRP